MRLHHRRTWRLYILRDLYHVILYAVVICVLLSAPESARAQCTDGSQPECTCATAPVLCTVDELDNYSFSMTSYQHSWDAPSPLCPPQTGTVSNNPTWFAFVAWCTTLTLLVQVSNCTPFQGSINGVQIAIYSSCNFNPPMPVACNTAASDCNTNDKTLTMNNLIIGNTYYFLIDGCAGAYCDVSIDVVGVCGSAEIAPWTQAVGGPLNICIGSSATHTAQNLNGATDYHWYINGMLISQGNGLLNFTHIWNTAGTFELCVDASNDPCIPESNPPLPNCITVTVHDAEAGQIQAVPDPTCPDGTVQITASMFNSAPGYQQYVIVTNSSGVIVAVMPGSSMSFTHNTCGTFFAYSYNYHTSGGNTPPVIGSSIGSLNCITGCCELEMEPFQFVDVTTPVFQNPPQDLALSCYDLLPPMTNLNWTDNCTGSGSAPGVQTGVADLCNGGVLLRQWEYADACGNTATHLQMITIAPLPPAMFVNPPANITVDCSNIPTSAPSLQVMNGAMGGCQILANVTPVQNGTGDVCGGSFSFVWQHTDVCNRTITHTQNITVTQIPEAAFVDIPEDITIECADIPTTPPSLNYTNGGTGPCAIAGSTIATLTGNADLCGGMLNNRWQYTDLCGRTIQANQVITVLPVPEAVFVNPPADITINCNQIPSSFSALSYTNGLSGACLISGSVDPLIVNNTSECGGVIEITWRFIDACNRTIMHVQSITGVPAPPPVWINPPGDLTVDCSVLPASVPDLAFSNGESGICTIAGTVPGVQILFDICQALAVYQWQYTDACGNTISHTQSFTAQPPPPVVFINPPADITITCPEVTFNPPPLMYTNNTTGPCQVSGTVAGEQSGTFFLCGGEAIRRWTVMDPCGVTYTYTQTITVLPAPPIAFESPPPDVTVNCEDVEPPMPLLFWNSMPMGPCGQIGFVTPEVSGAFDACGGEFVAVWEYTDICGYHLVHTQVITVSPATPPTFVEPPFQLNITRTCMQITDEPPGLAYTNGLDHQCQIEGDVVATRTGSYDACGGMLIHTWVVDTCNSVLSAMQLVTVTPAPEPEWIDPPADISLGCDDEYLPPGPLSYSNGLVGPCGIEGVALPEVIYDNYIYTHIWSYDHPCTGEAVIYEQHVTTLPLPDISLDPVAVDVCYGYVFDLSSIIVTEADGEEFMITYHTGTPASPSNQLGSPLVTITADRVYYFLATNSAGCKSEAELEVTVLPVPNAGPNNNTIICQTETVDFTSLIASYADPGGYWEDVDNSGADLTNIYSVRFNNVEPGTYRYYYIVSINECPPDTAVVTVMLNGPPDYAIDSVFCTNFNTTYAVAISGNNLVVVPSHGNVVVVPGGLVIENIPIDQILTFDIYENGVFCSYFISISPPNCDCPSVPPPISAGNVIVCFGEPVPPLEVIVQSGYTVHWYSAPTGGMLLASNSTTYDPTVTLPGIYTYYAETESLDYPGCLSTVRTAVTLEIRNLPSVSDLTLTFCDTLETGALSIDLSLWRQQINNNPTNMVTFHATTNDAISGQNALTMPVTASVGINTFYARVTNAVGCHSIGNVEVTVHALPAYTLLVTSETCDGFSDGTLTISGLDATQSHTVVLDGVAYTDQFVFTDLAPGTHALSVTSSVTLCLKSADFTVDQGMQLSLVGLILTCNDNGTDTDPDDDYYLVQFSVQTTGTSSTFELLADGVSQGYFTYGMPVSLNIQAMNQSIVLTAVDTTYGCTSMLATSPLFTCSSNCDIVVDAITQVCSDNGTPVDPADDFHTITITVSAVNGSVSNQYHVLLNGTPTYLFTYGMPEAFILPVSSPAPTIVLQDADDQQCFLNLNIGPLTGCSNQCVIPAPSVQYTCSDNNTPDDVTDDFYTVIFTPVVTNPGASATVEVLVDGVLVHSAPAGTVITLTLPADGATHVILVRDTDQPSCEVQWTTITLTPCSTLCIITVDATTVECRDNGTPMVPGDDFYVIQWNATAMFGSVSQTYTILLDGIVAGTGAYGTDEMLMIPADGMIHTINLRDIDELNCVVEIPLPALVHCSNDCVISVQIQSVHCDNNGTNQTEADDIFFVDVLVTGVNIPSGSWQLNGGPVMGTLGISQTLGPYPISGGDILLMFSAQGSGCNETIQITAPAPCSVCEQMIDAGPDVFLDCGMPSSTLSVSTSAPPGTITWTDPAGGTIQAATLSASFAGSYIVTVAFPDGCVFRDTVQVTADPTLPAVWAGPNRELNCEDLEATLEAQVLIGGPGVMYEWTDQSGTIIGTSASVTVFAPGLYFVRIYDPSVDCWSGQDATQVIDISNMPSAVIYASPGNLISCIIQSIILDSGHEPNVVYTWIANGIQYTEDNLIVAEIGTVYLIALDTITRCSAIDSIEIVTLVDYPVVVISPPMPLTCAATSVTLDASGSLPDTGGLFIWTNAAGDTIGMAPSVAVQTAGVYTLELTDPANGCVATGTVMVMDITEIPQITPAPDITLPCESEASALQVIVTSPATGLAYSWSAIGGQITGSANTPQVTTQGPGQYIVLVTHTPSQCTASDTITVTAITERPTGILVDAGQTSCAGVSDGTISLNQVQGGTPPYTFYVNGVQASSPLLTNLPAGNYLIQVEDANGCNYETTVSIATGDEVVVDLEAQVVIKKGENIVLMAGVNIPDHEISTVLWTPSQYLSCDTCLTTQASPLQDIVYTLTVTDIYGCTGTATVRIRVSDAVQVFIPNVISPSNRDQINDYFTVYSSKDETQILTMRIFDRWGAVLFEKRDFPTNIPEEGWDGTFRGEALNPGVFVYMVELLLPSGITEILKGDVTIIR
jgi:gliding motility-associated-like protein